MTTADRTITLPDPSATTMNKLTFFIRGPLTNTKNWKVSPSVGYVTSSNTDSFPNNSVVTIERVDNGSGQWRITNIWEPLSGTLSFNANHFDTTGAIVSLKAFRTMVKVTNIDYTIPTAFGDFTLVYFGTMTAAKTVTLPSAASNTGRRITIKHGGDGNFNINFNVGIKSNNATATLSIGQGGSIMCESDGTDWIKVY